MYHVRKTMKIFSIVENVAGFDDATSDVEVTGKRASTASGVKENSSKKQRMNEDETEEEARVKAAQEAKRVAKNKSKAKWYANLTDEQKATQKEADAALYVRNKKKRNQKKQADMEQFLAEFKIKNPEASPKDAEEAFKVHEKKKSRTNTCTKRKPKKNTTHERLHKRRLKKKPTQSGMPRIRRIKWTNSLLNSRKTTRMRLRNKQKMHSKQIKKKKQPPKKTRQLHKQC